MEVLEFNEHVRKRPGMYFGDTQDGSGANHIVFELVANVIDQFLCGKATRVDVEVDGHSIVVRDDGPGLAFDKRSASNPALSEAEDYFQNPHFSATAKGHAPHVHIANRGVGLAAVNAAFEPLLVRTDNGSQSWTHRYEAGRPIGEGEIGPSCGKTGTEYRAILSRSMFSAPDLTRLTQRLSEQAFLYPHFQIRLNGTEFVAQNGLLDLARGLAPQDTVSGPEIWLRQTYDTFQLDAVLKGAGDGDCVTRSWVNGVETHEGGSHVDGFNRAIASQGLAPCVKLLHIVMEDPKFAGPTTRKLHVPHIEKLVEAAMNTL